MIEGNTQIRVFSQDKIVLESTSLTRNLLLKHIKKLQSLVNYPIRLFFNVICMHVSNS